MKNPLLLTVFACAPVSTYLGAAITIDITGPSTEWSPVNYFNVQSDYFNDNQGGQNDIDIVGEAIYPSITANPAIQYQVSDAGTTSDTSDDEIAFRIRMGGPSGKKTHFSGYAWIGFDVDLSGSVDIFVGATSDKDSWTVGIYDAGGGLNTSPGTTSLVVPAAQTYTTGSTVASFDWAPVYVRENIAPGTSATDIDAEGDEDQFLSFSIPWQDFYNVVTTGLGTPIIDYEWADPVGIVAATSNSERSLNGDLNGIDGNSGGDWLIGEPVAVPEPAAYAFWLGFLALGFCLWHRCRR